MRFHDFNVYTRHKFVEKLRYIHLGFTHICGKTRKGKFTVLRQTIRKRMQAKLRAIKIELRRRMHDLVPDVGKWLRLVVGGHMRYYGVPTNLKALQTFRQAVACAWHRILCRRSHKGYVNWTRMERPVSRWLLMARICHTYPSCRVTVRT